MLRECTFNYIFEKPAIEDIEKFIIDLMDKYQSYLECLEQNIKKNLIKYNTEEYIKYTKEQKIIIFNIIKDVIAFFPQLLNIPHIVFIHGSFAKSLNRMNSDIDLNILYPNQYKNEILPVEELISIILQKIIGFSGRDKVHTMMIYTCSEVNSEVLESTQNCSIIFPDNSIYYYHCRPNFDEVMNNIKLSSRSYQDFAKYIKENIKINKCEEWTYSFEVLLTNSFDYDLYNLIHDIDMNVVSKMTLKNFQTLVTQLITSINNYNFDLSKDDNTVSSINKNIKVKNLQYIYKTLALLRRFLYMNKEGIEKLDFFEIFNNNFLSQKVFDGSQKEIKESVFMYMWQISRIESIFDSININFSSRNYNKISNKEIEEVYFYKFRDNIYEMQNQVTINLHKMLKNILENMLKE